MSTIYIKGDPNHGSEIIKYLEDNFHAHNCGKYLGNDSCLYYYVFNGKITVINVNDNKNIHKDCVILTYNNIKHKIMKKQTITIEVPEGKVAKQFVNSDGSITISYVDKEPIRSKSWNEFCKNHPNVKYELFINQHGGIDFRTNEPRLPNNSNNLETKEDAEGILALIQLTRLHDEWVGNWKPNWKTSSAYDKRFAIQSCYDVIGIDEIEEYCLLSFPTKEIAREFLDCFEDLIFKAKKFI